MTNSISCEANRKLTVEFISSKISVYFKVFLLVIFAKEKVSSRIST